MPARGPVARAPSQTESMKKTILAAALVAAVGSTSCLGPDPAYNSIKNWNATVTSQDWINEGIFLVIQPVYWLSCFGDLVIFNTVGYWSGNYIISEPGPFPGFKMD